jgi:hypothetical protein
MAGEPVSAAERWTEGGRPSLEDEAEERPFAPRARERERMGYRVLT